MKKQVYILFLALSVVPVFAQITAKEIQKNLVTVQTGIFASKYELSNKEYMNFLNDLEKSKSQNDLAIAQIDTVRWTDTYSYNEPYMHYYHRHPAYQDYPVVNVSYEAAQLYCNWLTEKYNADPKRKYKKVVFRLPTENEWAMAARAGDSAAVYAWSYSEGKGTVEALANYRSATAAKNMDVTAPVNSYKPNASGLYNICGNVAEMTVVKGTAKGGSWKDDMQALAINSKYEYDGKALPNVGFRYFAQIIEN